MSNDNEQGWIASKIIGPKKEWREYKRRVKALPRGLRDGRRRHRALPHALRWRERR